MCKDKVKSLWVAMLCICAWAKYGEVVIPIRELIANGIGVRAVAICSRYMLSYRKIKMIVVKTILYVCR